MKKHDAPSKIVGPAREKKKIIVVLLFSGFSSVSLVHPISYSGVCYLILQVFIGRGSGTWHKQDAIHGKTPGWQMGCYIIH